MPPVRYEPGISAESRGTVSIFDEYNIRGFKTYSNFYDGLRLPYDGAWNLMPQVDIYATELVEVVKGPASSLGMVLYHPGRYGQSSRQNPKKHPSV